MDTVWIKKVEGLFKSVSELCEKQADCLRLITDKIVQLEERQDVLWEALQGLTKIVNGKQEDKDG